MDFVRKAALKQSVNQFGRQLGLSSNVTDSLPGGGGGGSGGGGGGGVSGVAASISSAFGRGDDAPAAAAAPPAPAGGWGASTAGVDPPANYPPLLRLFYVDVDALDASPEVRHPLRVVHTLFIGGCWALYLNFVSWLVLLIRGLGDRTWTLVLTSAFLAGAGSLGLLCLYVAAFRGAASSSVSVQAWALGGLAAVLPVTAVYAFGGVWVWNGWTRLRHVADASGRGVSVTWRFLSVIESLVWTALLVTTLYAGGSGRVASTFARGHAAAAAAEAGGVPAGGPASTIEEIRARYGVGEV
ncbi:hypothetical protein MMPV_001863 [Pyropia vietnamensis]